MPDKKQTEWPIEVSSRAWAHVSQKAIGDVYDALVEIVTNSDDSYRQLYKDGKIAVNGGDIAIEIHHRQAPNKSLVIVKDRAEGMTFSGMLEKLVRIGDRTAGAESRGFMARGLRDCCTLGDIRVESLVDGKYHACHLPSNALKFHMVSDGGKVTEAVRKRLGTGRNCTVVTLECRDSVRVPRVKTLVRDLPMHYALRDIIGKEATKIRIRDGSAQKPERIMPLRIDGEKVVDAVLKLDGYPEAKPRLRIWRADSQLENVDQMRMRKSGILIADSYAVHQCTLLGHEQEPLAHHYYGRLDCDYIRRLLEENDECWKEKRDPPEKNPILLIDNNRQSGLDTRHPFTIALFAKINEHLKRLVEKDRKDAGKSKGDISNEETRARLSKLAKAADKFLKEQAGEDLTPGEETAIDAALKAGAYILPPKFKIGVGETRALHLYVHKDKYNPGRRTQVQTTNKDAVDLVETFANKVLQPHHADETVFWGALKVRGIAVGKAEIIVRPSKTTKVSAFGTVVRKREGGGRDFVEPLEFERKKYSVVERKRKKLKIFAELPLKGDTVARVFCSNEAVVVRQGGQCRLTPCADTNYAVGEIEIEGRSITARAVDVVAQLGSLSAKTSVRVVESKFVGGGLRFEPTKEDLGGMRARWDIEGDPNLLKISAVHPSTKGYFGDPSEKFPGQNTPECRALMAEIITEHVCLLILRKEMRGPRRGSFQFPVDDPVATLDQISGILQKKAAEFSVHAHKILGGD